MSRAIAAVGWILFIMVVLGLCCMMMEGSDADARTHILSGMESGTYVVSTGSQDTGGAALVGWEAEPEGKVYLGTFPFSCSAQIGVALASSGHQQWNPLTQVADTSDYVAVVDGDPVYTDFIGEGWYTIFVFDPAGNRLISKWRTE